MASSVDAERAAHSAGDIAKLVYNLRLLALLFTIVSIVRTEAEIAWFVWLLLALAPASFIPIRYWDRVGSTLMAHPAYLFVEVVLAILVVKVAGTSSPAFLYVLATALLSGLLYSWPGAGVFSVLLVGGSVWAVSLQSSVADVPDVQELAVASALVALLAVVGAALRRNLDRRAATELARAEAERAASAADERARLAREMHDSLAKTLRGVALQARALERNAVEDPGSVAIALDSLAEGAELGADQARSLISVMRADCVDLPLEGSLRSYLDQFANKTGIKTRAEIGVLPPMSTDHRFELFAIVVEALSNVDAHAQASRVELVVGAGSGAVDLELADDGCGFELPNDLYALCAGGQFGLVGIAERATRVGADLQITSAPGRGTVLDVRMPTSPQPRSRHSVDRGVAL